MAKVHPDTIKFLLDLSRHNDREWYNAQKKASKAARDDWNNFTQHVIDRLRVEANLGMLEAKQCTFRLQRDVRWAKDKTPYNTHFSAFITPEGKKSPKAGFYFRVKPDGESGIGGGLWWGEGPTLKAIRQEIDYCGDEWREIIEAPAFVKRFGKISGESLKRPPKGYDETHPHLEYLKMKQWLATWPIGKKEYASASFVEHIADSYQDLKPFLDFINRAFED